MNKSHWRMLITLGVLLLTSEPALAELSNEGIMNDVLKRFDNAASNWANTLTNAASWLFWTLVLISMVWTFGMMLLRKADIGEFFAEFVRFTIFTGFFWWLLTNAVSNQNIAGTIIDSLQQLGAQAGSLGTTRLDPGAVVDVGFELFDRVIRAVDDLGWRDFDLALAMMILGGVTLTILALIAVNMLVLLATSWIVLYAGVFFLGFGGARWTSDMALNYYRTIFGVSAQLLSMILIVAIGKQFINDFSQQISPETTIQELAVMMVASIILLVLTNKVPAIIAGIITGSSIGNTGIGQLGAGAALGAAGMATAATATAGAMIAAGTANAAGGAQAVMAAFSKANENVSSGSDVLSSMWGGGGNSPAGDGGVSSALSAGNTPFAQAAGFSNSSDSMWGRGEDGDTKRQTESGTDQAKSDGKQNSGPTESTSSAKTGQGGNRQSTGTQGGSFMAVAATSGKIAVDAGVNLAKGIADVAKAKANERIADTTPGKIAGAIRGGSSSETNIEFTGNSLSGENDAHSEVTAFVNRSNSGAPT